MLRPLIFAAPSVCKYVNFTGKIAIIAGNIKEKGSDNEEEADEEEADEEEEANDQEEADDQEESEGAASSAPTGKNSKSQGGTELELRSRKAPPPFHSFARI